MKFKLEDCNGDEPDFRGLTGTTRRPKEKKGNKMKTPVMEQRAKSFCAGIMEQGNAAISVKWTKSKTGDFNPTVLNFANKPMAHATGCGYDKLSVVLADALRFLGRSRREQNEIYWTRGSGEERVKEKLHACGWDLTHTHNTPNFDGFLIRKQS